MRSLFLIGGMLALAGAASLALGCTGDSSSNPLDPGAPMLAAGAMPPAGLVSVALAGSPLSLWPYTGVNFDGQPQDPINLVFTGRSDPRTLRAAFFGLDGDRTSFGMPNVYPFNCTWSDAIGDLQTGYNDNAGWTGSAIQLACGSYGPVRFHVRLFDAGAATLGNAHFELLIPGTTDHQVLSWEVAEQLVRVDLVRSGLLDAANPVGSTGLINAAPSFREIPQPIYNGIPEDLKQLIGGPSGTVSSPVPIGTDGQASVFNLSGEAALEPGLSEQDFVIQFGQVIPRPFCVAGPPEYLLVEGPVNLRKTVRLTGTGELTSEFLAHGRLRLTPVDPSTGAPIGTTYAAEVEDHQVTRFDDSGGSVNGRQRQMELPENEPGRGWKMVRLEVGPRGQTRFDLDNRCKP
jgi:hypothetical protein